MTFDEMATVDAALITNTTNNCHKRDVMTDSHAYK